MSLLDMISGVATGAAVRCGLTPPTALFGSSDPNAPLLIALAQEEGDELARRHDWQAITKGRGFAALGGIEQVGAIPSDYDRLLSTTVMWNSTLGLKYLGPVNDDFEWTKVNQIPVSPGAWRMVSGAGRLFITPAPSAGNNLGFTYVSKNWVRSNTGAEKAAFTADTDTVVFPERLMALGIVWRWKMAKGFAYAEPMATYEREVERACSRDRGFAPITVGKGRSGADSGTWPGLITP